MFYPPLPKENLKLKMPLTHQRKSYSNGFYHNSWSKKRKENKKQPFLVYSFGNCRSNILFLENEAGLNFFLVHFLQCEADKLLNKDQMQYICLTQRMQMGAEGWGWETMAWPLGESVAETRCFEPGISWFTAQLLHCWVSWNFCKTDQGLNCFFPCTPCFR